jgi:hypothetical protein
MVWTGTEAQDRRYRQGYRTAAQIALGERPGRRLEPIIDSLGVFYLLASNGLRLDVVISVVQSVIFDELR